MYSGHFYIPLGQTVEVWIHDYGTSGYLWDTAPLSDSTSPVGLSAALGIRSTQLDGKLSFGGGTECGLYVRGDRLGSIHIFCRRPFGPQDIDPAGQVLLTVYDPDT